MVGGAASEDLARCDGGRMKRWIDRQVFMARIVDVDARTIGELCFDDIAQAGHRAAQNVEAWSEVADAARSGRAGSLEGAAHARAIGVPRPCAIAFT